MTVKKRLGIYGGTFSPSHTGHVRAAEAFARTAELDELLIMPTFMPPHKAPDSEASPEDRLEMCRLAFSHIENARVSDFEILRGGKSYTYLTLSEMSSPDTELYFLVGTDMFLTLDLWKAPEIIFSLATIALVRRESDRANDELIKQKTLEFEEKFGARIITVPISVTEISSTELRLMIKRGESTDGLLPPSVREYIDKNDVYGASFTERGVARLSSLVASRLSEKRFSHTLGVMRAALRIAESCMPERKWELAAAALLHDVAKELPSEEQLSIIKSVGVCDEDDLGTPSVFHAFAAPELIKRDFPEYASEAVLSSAFYHTTADSGISLFDEIIFVADYVEDTREYPECRAAAEELFGALKNRGCDARTALHKCAIREIENTLSHLRKKGAVPNSRTLRAYKYFYSKIT